MHLQRLRENWIPAFRPGPERARLRRYLPGLEQLVARVTLQRVKLMAAVVPGTGPMGMIKHRLQGARRPRQRSTTQGW